MNDSELCWVDLWAFADATASRGAVWSDSSDDLNVNLVVLDPGGEIRAHVNREVDVLIVGVSGHGWIEANGERHELRAGVALVVPKGARRSSHAGDERLAYLTCHRRRAGLWPGGRRAGE